MSTAQPAPVTPPPESPAQLAEMATLANKLWEWMMKHNVTHLGPIMQRHAPPPAPSCPTEQGELVERLRLAVAEMRDATLLTANECLIKDSFAALSRQPAPSGIAEHRWEELVRDLHAQIDENGVHGQTDGSIQAKINAVCKERDDHKARIASLEAELAIFRENNGNLIQQVEELQRTLRAAPSAVAKDRAEVVERLHYTLQFVAREMSEEHAKTVNDAISLLSQPAVAQTEAGNDRKGTE